MSYIVVINHGKETAHLYCNTIEEARNVRASFINWGGFGFNISIVSADTI
jgi:hypothetical protein